MTLFPKTFFMVLVYAAILLTILGGTTLIVLLVRDWKAKKIW